ncbi:hypothetical protein HZA97_03875 [Candidatus Woesearchaeota archaeon]|nr:hypothetical protein [Candidatus Woesearchaeota archaeon]
MNFKEILFFNAVFFCFYSGLAVAIVAYSTKQVDLFSVLILGLFGSPILSAALFLFPSLRKEKQVVEKEEKQNFFQKKKEGGEKNDERSSFD